MVPMEPEPFRGDNLCENKECKLYGKKHRHTINECLSHMFCGNPPMEAIDGTYKDLPEKLPQTSHKDQDDTRSRAYKGSKYVGYDQLLKTQNECGYFGHEREIPQGKKLIVTEEIMDCWLAAHYGLQIHEVPSGKPAGMNKSIHSYIKVTARKTRDLMKDIEKAQKRAGSRGPSQDASAPLTAKEFGSMGGGVSWQVSPAKFEGMYLSNQTATMSYADKMIKIDAERKQKKRRRRQANNEQSSESGSRSQQSSTSPSISTRGLNTAAGSTSKVEIPAKVVEDENEYNVSTHSYRNPQRFVPKPKNKYDAKIPEDQKYRAPQAYVKNRINSESLNFMNYQEIEKISKANLTDMAAKIELSKQRKRDMAKVKSPSPKPQDQKDKSGEADQKDQKGSQSSIKANEIFEFSSPDVKIQSKKYDTKPEVNKRQINNLNKQRQNIQEMLKMFQVQESTLYNKMKPKPDPKSQTSKINFSSFDFKSSAVNINQPRVFQKREERFGQRVGGSTSVSRKRPKTGVVGSYNGQQRKLVSGFKSRTQAFSNTSQRENMPVNTTVSLGGGPLSDSRRLTAHQFQNSDRINEVRVGSEAGRNSINKAFKRVNDSQTGKSGVSTGIFDVSHTNNFSSQQFQQSPQSAVVSRRNQRATTGQLQKPMLVNSTNFEDEAKAFFHSDLISPRVTSSITNQDFLYLLNKKQKDKKDLTNLSQLAQSAKRRLQVISSQTNRGGSKIKMNEKNPIRDSVSTKLRIKNEQVTSKILLDQYNLQQVLSHQFSVDCSRVELPVYTKLQMVRDSKELDNIVDRSIVSPNATDQKQASMFTDASIVRYGKLQSGQSQSKEMSQSVSKMEELTKEASMTRVTSGNVTFQNIKSNFGLHQDPTYHNVAGRGFKGVNLQNLNSQSTKATKIEVPEPDLVEQASLEKEKEKGWTAPIKHPPGKDKHATKQEILAQHNSWLVQQILNALNDEIEKKGSTDKDTEDTTELGQASVASKKPSESVNVKIQLYVLDLTVSKVYKNFKDYKFWLQQSQIRKNHPSDWASALDYLASGLRELPLEIKLLYNYASLNEKLERYDIALQFFDFCLEIRPRWTDALFGKAVTYFKLGEFKKSKKCVKTAIHNYKDDSFEQLEVMQYFQAMCYKNLGKYAKAERDYGALTAIFRQEEGDKVKSHIVGCILLPLQTNRIEQHEFMENTLSLISFFQKCEPLQSSQRLDQYVHREGPRKGFLDIETHWLQIYYRVEKKPFFRRFSKEFLFKYMTNAKVEYYKSGEIIFLKGQVAVIKHGSVRVMSHQDGILTPTTIGKYGEGRILGHEPSDGGITVNPQSWFTTFDDDTELVIFDQKTFNKLWSLQSFRSSKLILESFLRQNLFWENMSEQTKYHLIFESAEVRKYRPGQLIARVSKRSAVVEGTYGKYYKETAGKMKEQFENQKREEQADQSINKAMGQQVEEPAETVMSQYVVKLTKQSGSALPPSSRNQNTRPQAQGNHNPSAILDAGLSAPEKIDLQFQPDEADVERFNFNQGGRGPKQASSTVKRKLQKLRHAYRDQNYQEADGIYFIYHGTVDIVNPGTRECIYQMGITENFGESKLLRRPSFEYMGDLYAGLKPKGRVTGKLIPDIPFHDRSAHFSQIIKFGNLVMDDKSGGTEDKFFTRSPRTKINDKITDDIRGRMEVQNLIPEENVATVLNENDDCVICIFIPYRKFLEVVPSHEIKKIKQCQELQSKKDGIINLFSTKYGFQDNELYRF